MSEVLSSEERARGIRSRLARLEALEMERRQLLMELAPLEAEESRSMGYTMPLRGKRLVEVMDRRDARENAA